MTINGVGNGGNYLKQAVPAQGKNVEAEALSKVKQAQDAAPKRLDPSGTFNKSDQGGKDSLDQSGVRASAGANEAQKVAEAYEKEDASSGPLTASEVVAKQAEERNQVGIQESFKVASSPLDKDGDGSLSLDEAIDSKAEEKLKIADSGSSKADSVQGGANRARQAAAASAYQEMEKQAQIDQGSSSEISGGTVVSKAPTDSALSSGT